MIFVKEEFKELWESNKYGSGITFNDIIECAVAWGILCNPRIHTLEEITYKVLKAAKVSDAEEYKPTSHFGGRIMIDLDKACEWLERNISDIYSSPCNPEKIVEQFRKAMNID